MPYDQTLGTRIRQVLSPHTEVVEKKMFGGVGFMVQGNMVCGVIGNDLIVRVGAENNEQALAKPFTRPFMSPRGEPMAGWILVATKGITSDRDFIEWVELGYAYASTLPPKR